MTNKSHKSLLTAAVWFARIAVGTLFIVSGLSKGIDIWGFVYKIEEYLDVWQVQSWRSLNFVGAMAISGAEFVCGAMLLIGAFRRSVTWWLLAIMVFMLPLSFYIMVKNPVADCGCFGDFWIISNTATFWKNVAIVAALIFLVRYNRVAGAPVNPYLQWLPLVICSCYFIIVGLTGYNIQPLVDFRSFPIGSQLIADDSEEDDEEATDNFTFIYERAGERREFTVDNLPDSTWDFVERRDAAPTSRTLTDFTIIEDGVDIAPEIIATEGEQYLLVITDLQRTDISYTLALNEISEHVRERGGNFTALVASTDLTELEFWQDISMSDYPIYTAEPTLLKELSRGVMSLVKLSDGRVVWKRTVSSLSIDNPTDAEPSGLVGEVILHGPRVLALLSLLLLGSLLVIAFPSLFIRTGRKAAEVARKGVASAKNKEHGAKS